MAKSAATMAKSASTTAEYAGEVGTLCLFINKIWKNSLNIQYSIENSQSFVSEA